VTYTPDAAGRTLSAVDIGNNINYATGATYGPDSSLTGFVRGNSGSFAGVTNTFSFNNRLQPVTMSAATPSATVFSISYNFNVGKGDNGNVIGITNNRDATRSQSFSYDQLNRLTSAQNAGTDCTQAALNGGTKFWGNSYVYDPWGNLLQKIPTKNPPQSPAPCKSENLSVTALANNQLSGYGYDAAGNMTHDATTGNNYSYDAENRITGSGGFTYTYDADGNRVEKSNGGTGTIYWYMSPGIVAESDLTGSLTSEYVFFNGERVARKDFPSNTVSYYFSDHLKTASVITDSAGNIKEDEDYFPYGGEVKFVDNDPNHYKFTGKERDMETGLDYFGARYYGNALGRFMTPDWSPSPAAIPYADLIDPQTLNQYSYVRNVPTSRADPDGHCDIAIGGGKTEHHWGWCIWHTVGFYETSTEKSARIENERNQILNNTRHADGSPLTDAERKRIRGLSQTQVDERYKQLKQEADEREADDASRRAMGLPPVPVPGGNKPPLQRIHSNETLDAGQSYEYWKGKSTEEIVDSLKPGKPEALRVKPDGRVMNGNNRIRVLEERGVDVNSLDREEIK
jgi:RHS repeat-associated protein